MEVILSTAGFLGLRFVGRMDTIPMFVFPFVVGNIASIGYIVADWGQVSCLHVVAGLGSGWGDAFHVFLSSM